MDRARLELLDRALSALLETLQPDQDADAARREVVADMQQLVTQALPPEFHCSVETFGSYRAGLYLPGSDLDFALAGWVAGPDDRQIELHEWNMLEQQYLLSDLADALEQAQLVQGQVERVLHARVPVIKFTHKGTGLACDFSINRPECTFKADMQKLLGSLDRRYGTLYRLVKAWAAAHGLNDAAANTLNSWSLGLLVAFYLQCGTSPAVLPPIWQLFEKEPPDVRQPRVLQLPNINSAMLKRAYNHAATGAGVYATRRAKAGTDTLNCCSIGELLAGFFEFYTPVLTDWSNGRNSSWRASTWWGDWKDAAWYPAKNYIFSIEDPFNAGDNTARAVGTHSHLSSCRTASYIAATCAASHEQLQRALSSSSSSSNDSSSSSSDASERDVITAYAWLFGPHSVLQLHKCPNPLQTHLQQAAVAPLCKQLERQLQQCQDCMELLSNSSGLVNRDNSPVSKDPDKVDAIGKVLGLFKQVLQELGCTGCHVCLGDYLAHQREIEAQEAEQREQQRQEMRRQQEQQRRELLLQQGLDPDDWQQQQQQQMPEVLAAMQGLRVSSGSSGRQQQQRPRRSRSGQQQQQQYDGLGDSLRASSSSSGGGGRSNGSFSRGQERRQASAPPDIPAIVQHPSRRQQQQQGVTYRAEREGVAQQVGAGSQPRPRQGGSSRNHKNGDEVAVGGSRIAANALAGLVSGKGPGRANGYGSSKSGSSSQQAVDAEL